jgi:2-hydroxy-6-oxonona-2,4-dienedioate hydrolase
MDEGGLRSTWIDVDGVRVHLSSGGVGEPIVLVHGFGVSGTYMLPLARSLADRHSVFVPDLPGHGRSERPDEPLGVAGLAGALASCLDVLELERPVLVANSLGCQVVTELAVRQPERVGPLVLIGPTIDPARRRARRQVLAALRDLAREPLSLLAVTAHDDAVMGPKALLATVRSAFADRIEERLPLLEQRVLVVRGERDPFVTADWAERAVALLPDGRLAVVPGAPHAVHFSQPDVVAGLVDDFLVEEGKQERGKLVGQLPHRDMSARQQGNARAGEEALPFAGDARGREPVALAPDDEGGRVHPGELGPHVTV